MFMVFQRVFETVSCSVALWISESSLRPSALTWCRFARSAAPPLPWRLAVARAQQLVARPHELLHALAQAPLRLLHVRGGRAPELPSERDEALEEAVSLGDVS